MDTVDRDFGCLRALYGVAHKKPDCRLADQRGCRSWTLYRKLKKCKCKVLTC